MTEIDAKAQEIVAAYRALYEEIHAERARQYQDAIERVKSRQEWEQVPESMCEPVLEPLVSRACAESDFLEMSLTCSACHANINQMESDIAAPVSYTHLDVYKRQRIQRLTHGRARNAIMMR